MRILIVTPVMDFAKQLSFMLKNEGHEVISTLETSDLPSLAQDVRAQIVVYELLLGRLDEGLNQCRQLRVQSKALLMIVSETSRLEDKLGAFAAGADDYLGRPFDMSELYARILALLRRYPYAQVNSLSNVIHVLPDVKVNLRRQIINVKDQEIYLRPLEFKLLTYFIEHPNVVLPRERLLDAVWGNDHLCNTREVDIYVHYLRQRIEPHPNEPQYLRTIWGVGYIFSPND